MQDQTFCVQYASALNFLPQLHWIFLKRCTLIWQTLSNFLNLVVLHRSTEKVLLCYELGNTGSSYAQQKFWIILTLYHRHLPVLIFPNILFLFYGLWKQPIWLEFHLGTQGDYSQLKLNLPGPGQGPLNLNGLGERTYLNYSKIWSHITHKTSLNNYSLKDSRS